METFENESAWAWKTREEPVRRAAAEHLGKPIPKTPEVTHRDLEGWYQTLDRLVEHDGDVEGIRNELHDLRDDIYSRLRG